MIRRYSRPRTFKAGCIRPFFPRAINSRGLITMCDGIAGWIERSVSDRQHADERCCSVRRSRVVLTPRRWRQVRGCCVGPTGRGDNANPQTTVAKEPGHRGERGVSRKTIACGNVGRFRCTRCYSCAFYRYNLHTRPRVHWAPDVPHALFGRKVHATPRALRAARAKTISYSLPPAKADGPSGR
jgi:hypothetical protein